MTHFGQNDLGGREYSPAEEHLIHMISTTLRNRDKTLNDFSFQKPRPRPKDYIFLYVKAAGVVFEAARALASLEPPLHMEKKTLGDWLEIITGSRFILDNVDWAPMPDRTALTTAYIDEQRQKVIAVMGIQLGKLIGEVDETAVKENIARAGFEGDPDSIEVDSKECTVTIPMEGLLKGIKKP